MKIYYKKKIRRSIFFQNKSDLAILTWSMIKKNYVLHKQLSNDEQPF